MLQDVGVSRLPSSSPDVHLHDALRHTGDDESGHDTRSALTRHGDTHDGHRPSPPPPHGGPHPRQPQRGDLPPALWRCLLGRGTEHHRDVVLPRRRRPGAAPPHRGRCRAHRHRARRHRCGTRRCRPRRTRPRTRPRPRPRWWGRLAALRRDRAGRADRGRRDGPRGLRLAGHHPLGRPDPAGRAGLRRCAPDARGPGRAVRLQQRLPRHHRDRPLGHEGPAGVQPRVHQRGHHVPARHRPRDRRPHRVGRARHVGRRAASPSSRRHLALRPRRAPEPPDHPRHAVRPRRTRRRFGPAEDRRGPDRHEGPRDDEQLRRRHHPVGHGAVGRGELQPVLQGHRHRPAGGALRPLPHPGHARLARLRPALGRHLGGVRQRAQPVRLDRRGRPVRPALHAGEAHRDGSLQARGRQRDRQPRRARGRLHGRRRALRLPLPLRVEGPAPRARRQLAPPRQPLAAQRGRPVGRTLHRRRSRGRHQRRHR